MANTRINIDLMKKINSFIKEFGSLKYLDPSIFETIDEYKEISDIEYGNYYIEYISSLPKLDFESVVKIAREVYQTYGKEEDFDKILEKMIDNHNIENGSLNPEDDNCITKATESRVLLSGTYYDVVLLCHEVGHKLRYDDSISTSDIMDSFLFETPSIMLEFAASDYLRDKYGVDINAEEVRKKHIMSTRREDSIEDHIFQTVIKLLQERKLGIIDLYREFMKDSDIFEYFSREDSSIEDCVDLGISSYSYDVGYILGSYINGREDKIELLNMLLKYKDKGIEEPFTIDTEIIKDTLKDESKKEHEINPELAEMFEESHEVTEYNFKTR